MRHILGFTTIPIFFSGHDVLFAEAAEFAVCTSTENVRLETVVLFC